MQTKTLEKVDTLKPVRTRKSSLTAVDPEVAITSVRKANDVVLMRVRSETFSVQARKLYNTLIALTQNTNQASIKIPEASEALPNPSALRWAPLPVIVSLQGRLGRNVKKLKELFDSLKQATIESDHGSVFTSQSFINEYAFVQGKGSRPTMVGWTFPVAVEHAIENPLQYTTLMLDEMVDINQTAEYVLYETCRKHLTAPGGLTRKEHWNWWFEVLTGQPIGRAQEYSEKHGVAAFRYFKRDVVIPAMAECFARGLCVELLEFRKQGPRDAHIQFSVRQKVTKKNTSATTDWMLVEEGDDAELVEGKALSLQADIRRAMTISDKELARLFKGNDLNRIYRNFKYVTEVVGETARKPVGYLFEAVKGDYAAVKAEEALKQKARSTNAAVIDVQAIELSNGSPQSEAALRKARLLASKSKTGSEVQPKKKAAVRSPSARVKDQLAQKLGVSGPAQSSLEFDTSLEVPTKGPATKRVTTRRKAAQVNPSDEPRNPAPRQIDLAGLRTKEEAMKTLDGYMSLSQEKQDELMEQFLRIHPRYRKQSMETSNAMKFMFIQFLSKQ